jgi:hypothetical protein
MNEDLFFFQNGVLSFILSVSLNSLIFFFLGVKDKCGKRISQELAQENSSPQLNSLSSADEDYMKNNNLF